MLRVLSMWQPHASLACTVDSARGVFAKQHETRHWDPTTGWWAHRLGLELPVDVAIHATMRDEGDHGDLALRRLIERCGLTHHRPRGAILAIAQLVSVCRTTACNVDMWETAAGHWAPGRFAWRLQSVQRLSKPFPLRGRQDPLWILPAEIEAAVRDRVCVAA